MCHLTGPLKTTALIALAAGCTIASATIAGAAEDDSRAQRNAYVVAPLVSNVAGGATMQDTVLQNAWGVAFSPAGSPFWVNDNGTGCSTLYSGVGTKLALQVSIPLPGNVVPAASCHAVDPNNPPSPAPATPTGIASKTSRRSCSLRRNAFSASFCSVTSCVHPKMLMASPCSLLTR